MNEKHHIENISAEDFDAVLKTYNDEVPDKLNKLEEQRVHLIPKALSERKPAYLTKTEVQTLVDWKLAHGTFRPSLRKLVASNSEEAIEQSTQEAFALYAGDDQAWSQAISMLAKALKGVGPATASLLLNAYDGENMPFFSDELFRWCMFEDKKGGGWDRKMKYSIGEYKQMLPTIQALRERLGRDEGKGKIFTALDAEMVAYVLGRRADGEGVTRGTKRAAVEDQETGQTTTKEVSLRDAKHDGKRRRRPVPA